MSEDPRIIAFLCNWCAYSAADGAGAARTPYPDNVRIVRVMCTARVEPAFVLKSLSAGADGVLICGCHPGDCHYIEGNLKTLGRMELLARLTAQLGIPAERVRLEWIGASEIERIVLVAQEMTAQLRALGPFVGHASAGGGGR